MKSDFVQKIAARLARWGTARPSARRKALEVFRDFFAAQPSCRAGKGQPVRVFLILLLSLTSQGANHYIRSSATGQNDGSSWANAFKAIPTNLVRGDTYYIAGGTYTGDVTLASTASGTTRVTLKKANAADNSGDAGWDSTYASTQAVIVGDVAISNSYITIDGVTGSGESGHGIKILKTTGGSGNATVNQASGTSFVQVLHVELEGVGMGYSVGVSGYKNNNTGSTVKGNRYAYLYFHDMSQNGFVFVNSVGTSYSDYGVLFENNVIKNSGYNIAGQHGQGIQCGSGAGASKQSYWIIRNSVFYNVIGTADIACLGFSTNDHFLIYNNLFYNDNLSFEAGVWIPWATLKDASSPGVIYFSDTSQSADSVGIYNNTFYRVSRNTIYFGSTSTNNTVKNNLFLSGHFNQIHVGVSSSTNNDYWDCAVIISSGIYGCPYNEPAQQGESASPVVNAAVADFHLKTSANAIGHGENLSSLFTVDFAGMARPAVGAWDIGAYQYSVTPAIVSPPTNLQVQTR